MWVGVKSTYHKVFCLVLICSLLLTLCSFKTSAQIAINSDTFKHSHSLSVTFLDKESKEPLSYVTLFLTAEKDSAIVAFTVSDERGRAIMEDIPSGRFIVHAELLGYKPFSNKETINKIVDLGVVLLENNLELIDPASITAYSPSITFKKDTVIYNALAFNVMADAVLEDLIKKMPGLSVDGSGVVTINGQPIEHITVEGRTFFFNDPSLVLKSLPANIIQRILIIDENRDETVSGENPGRNKTMDVQLKPEYLNGWFGQIRIKGGTPVAEDDTHPLGSQPLFSTNSMAAFNTEERQLTFLGIGNNVNDSGGGTHLDINYQDDYSSRSGGISTELKTGLNYNTEKNTKTDLNASVSYYLRDRVLKENSSSLLLNGQERQVLSENEYTGLGKDNMISANVDITSKEDAALPFEFNPIISYSTSNRNISSTTDNSVDDQSSSYGMSSSNSSSSTISLTTPFDMIFPTIGGKNGRSMALSVEPGISFSKGNEDKFRYGANASAPEDLELTTTRENRQYYVAGRVLYREPLSERWAIRIMTEADFSSDTDVVDAFDIRTLSRNDYHSSNTVLVKTGFMERIAAQYRNNDFSIQFGPTFEQFKTIAKTTSAGKENSTDSWQNNWSPFIGLSMTKGNSNYSINYEGTMVKNDDRVTSPILDASNPESIYVGNIYLKPSYIHSILPSMYITGAHSMLYFSPSIIITSSPIVLASWFDSDNIKYGIPVNARKPAFSSSASIGLTRTIGQEMKWNIDISLNAGYSISTTYQAKTSLPGIEISEFEYNSLFKDFWGNDSGNLFYSGSSGFAESDTENLNYSASGTVSYKGRLFTFRFGGSVDNDSWRYSINPKANVDWWKFRIMGDLNMNINKDFEFEPSFYYTYYQGCIDNEDIPEFIINLKATKNIKKICLSLTINDLLNQRKSFHRYISGAGIIDQTTNSLGRYVLLGVSFNFGKTGEKSNDRVKSAVNGIISY